MKNHAKPSIILLLILFAQSVSAHTYYFKQEEWDFGPNLKLESITLRFDNGGSITITNSNLYTYTTSRITRVTRSIVLIKNGIRVEEAPYTIDWPSNQLQISIGSAPVYPLACWNPNITFTSNSDKIHTDQQVTLTFDRKGYTGPLDIFAGNNSSFSDRSFKLLTVSGSANTVTYIPETSWSSFSQLLGGDLNAFVNNFYLRFQATFKYGLQNNYSFNLNSGSFGPYQLIPVLETDLPPGGIDNICTKVLIAPKHLPPSYIISVKQGTTSKNLFNSFDDPTLQLDYLMLYEKTGFKNNIPVEIVFTSTSATPQPVMTRPLVVTFLGQQPDIAGLTVNINKQSCEEVQDGAIYIRLPKKSPTFKLRVNVEGVKNVVTEMDNVTIPLLHGNYHITLEYQQGDVPFGCNVDLGVRTIPLTDKLTIESIQETHVQSCYYKNDAELTVNARGGVQEGPYTYYNIGVSSSTDKVFRNLSGNTTYSFKVTDIKGCSSNIVSYKTTGAETLKISINEQAPIRCAGDKGTIIATGSGGSGSYLYSLDGGPYISSGIFDNLQGTIQHTLKLQDAKLCTTATTFNLYEPPKLRFTEPAYELSNYYGYNVLCRDDSNGEIILNGTGGTGKIKYILGGAVSLLQESNRFVSLGAGVYNVHMSDENGCVSETIQNITLTEPAGIEFHNPQITRETCNETKDGRILVNVSAEPSSLQWYNSNHTMLPGKTTKDLNNVGAGSYYLSAKYNQNECTDNSPLYVIPVTPPIEFSVTSHESCSDGIGGGEIKITGVSGGNGPYKYVFNSEEPNDIPLFPVTIKNLNAGNYPIEIRDGNYARGGIFSEKCKSKKTVSLFPKNPVSLIHTITEPQCHGDENGSISVQLSGPDQPFVQEWLNSTGNYIGAGNQLENIKEGTYKPLISDSYKCNSLLPAITVQEPERIRFTGITTEKASCREISDGTVSFASLGGTGLHTYSFNSGSTWSPVPNKNGLSFGNHGLLVRDSHGCIGDTLFTIEAFDPEIHLLAFDSVTCHGISDGSLEFKAVSGKTENYTYSLIKTDNSFINSTGLFYNLGKAEYYAFAKDVNGCFTDTIFYKMDEPDPLEVKLSLVDSSSCGQSTGKITFSISGGNGGNLLVWSNSDIGETPDLITNELKTGLYYLNVTDRKGCTQTSSIMIPDRPSPVITGFEIIDSTWCDLPLGSVKVNVTGGSPAYRYLWDNPSGDTLVVAGKLKAGIYSVKVSDRYNCTDEESIEMKNGPGLEISTYIENPHCGMKDGYVALSVIGGVQPYTFKWPDSISVTPLSSGMVSKLASGSYPVLIRDEVGCSRNFVIELDDLTGPEITRINLSKAWCGLPRGKAEVLAGGGSPPYTFSWSKTGTNVIIGSDNFINNVTAGNYTIKVTDSENCRVTKTVQITDSVELQPTLVLRALDSSSCSKPTGNIEVSMLNGMEPYSYTWNTGFTGSTLLDVAKGIYKVRATDQRGCIDSLEIELPEKDHPVIKFISSENSYCAQPSGSVLVGASRGKAPYRAYVVSNPGKQEFSLFDQEYNLYTCCIDSLLPSSTPYKIRLKDSEGCESNEISAFIRDYNPMTIYLSDVSPVSCYGLSDGRAVVSVNNGFEPYYYHWDKNTVNSNINSSLTAGAFSVTISDARGCVRTFKAKDNTITQPTPLSLEQEIVASPSCYGVCDGLIWALAKGGNGNYRYIWNYSDTIQTLRNLCEGNQHLKVVDAKNCSIEKMFSLFNPEPLSETDLPESMTICTGQNYLADPGNQWNNVSWSSDYGFHSDEHTPKISKPGFYYMKGYSLNGCLVRDTLKLIVSDNLLDAEFLMMSEAHTGDTVVIIEVSWPVAENYVWEIPESAEIISEGPYYKELVFEEAGSYYVQLTATLAGCYSVCGKHIEILDLEDDSEIEQSNKEEIIKEFIVYPNPAEYDLSIDVELAVEQDIRIEIFNAGSGMLNRIIPGQSMNSYSFRINMEELPRGMYIVRLVSGNVVRSKVLVLR